MIGIMVAIGASVFAHTDDEAKLTKEEAQELVGLVKQELKIEEDYVPILDIDENGMLDETNLISIIKIYDSNDELLLEAPITKLRQYKNKHLRRLLNASDYLTEYGNTKYYRLDIR